MKIKDWIIHPILFSVYPILFYYSHNIGQVNPENIVKPIAITGAGAIFGWWFLRLILKDWRRSGGIVSVFLLLFFSYGHARTNIDIAKATYALPAIWISILLLVSFGIIKSKAKFVNGTKILNVISLVLLTFVALNIGMFHIRSSLSNREYSVIDPGDYINIKDPQQVYPDIYFIILDAYAREDILKEIYNFDNAEFLDFLKDNGFYVADKAISNYGQTGLSLGACFNLTYLDKWFEAIGKYRIDRKPLRKIIEFGFVTRFLKERGYKIVSFASDRDETQLKSADIYLRTGMKIDEFQTGLKNITPLPDLAKKDKDTNRFDLFRQKVLYVLDNLGKVANIPDSPKFVFAHIELPHPPFVFGPNGEHIQLEARFNDYDGDMLIKKGRISLEQYIKSYRNQVIFCNKKIKESIKNILSNSPTKPIIMVLGDHGPRSGVVWNNPYKTDVRECMSILNAYYLPDGDHSNLYPEISPVNSFRVVFNQFFGTDFELLEDKSFFSTALYLYDVYDVTERVRREK